MFSHEFPKREFVYYYYCKWASLEEFDLLLEQLRESSGAEYQSLFQVK